MKTFYNCLGIAIAYSDDEVHIYSFNGKPLGYIYEDKVYSFRGKHLGWYVDGWIRDVLGYCVFFSEIASGGPAKPSKRAMPAKYSKSSLPSKAVRQIAGAKPIKRLAWSRFYDSGFFYQ